MDSIQYAPGLDAIAREVNFTNFPFDGLGHPVIGGITTRFLNSTPLMVIGSKSFIALLLTCASLRPV